TLVGIRPEIAQTLVSLGVTFDSLTTAATLQQGLKSAMAARPSCAERRMRGLR
ncbi:MAG: hypothetical protein HGB28_01505, partial [Oscillochloris sp.]|nr:hypothetical protein [Oscillochloris sp.]